MLKYFLFVFYTCFLCVYCDGRDKRASYGEKWPSNQIPYSFDEYYESSTDNQDLIKQAMKVIEDSVAVNGEKCIEFIPRSNEQNYIQFKNALDCSAMVGHSRGINSINLSSSRCMSQSTIIHEIMHRLGFDHEQSRVDRDRNVEVLYTNIPDEYKNNFEVNRHLNKDVSSFDTPYDFLSILHYNSDDLIHDKTRHSMLIKYPALLNDNKIKFERETLSPIDIIQLQRFYGCTEASIQSVTSATSKTDEQLEDIAIHFESEASRLKINETIALAYFARSLETCGVNHYWPFDYPIVEQNHELYRSVCQSQKGKDKPCKFTLECQEGFECSKVLFRNGVCRRPNANSITTFAKIIGSKVKQFGRKLSKEFNQKYMGDIKKVIKKLQNPSNQ